jgi:hypothetical protein
MQPPIPPSELTRLLEPPESYLIAVNQPDTEYPFNEAYIDLHAEHWERHLEYAHRVGDQALIALATGLHLSLRRPIGENRSDIREEDKLRRLGALGLSRFMNGYINNTEVFLGGLGILEDFALQTIIREYPDLDTEVAAMNITPDGQPAELEPVAVWKHPRLRFIADPSTAPIDGSPDIWYGYPGLWINRVEETAVLPPEFGDGEQIDATIVTILPYAASLDTRPLAV